MKYNLVIITLALILVASQYIKNHFALYDARAKLLRKKWKAARKARLLWKDEHTLCFNFGDPEYQKLWEIEIGAEDLYLLYSDSVLFHGISMSWQDYKFEQKESEREKM